ncbi:MAG: AAA family ATPase [Burkholderiales bacterium]|nr:AAA family ATPase [Burkholderiales bacterium]
MDRSRFVLKTTPPRAHRTAIARPRLDRLWSDIHERTLIEVCAPGGFGKSTLLVQWRRRWLERGALVAWATLDAQDTPLRFASLLGHALRVASGRSAFENVVAEAAGEPDRVVDALTALLAEIAGLATPTVLILDDGEHLPAETVDSALSYLLMNAPANLQVVFGSRAPVPLPSAEWAASGNLGRVGVDDLRLDLDESVALLAKRFGKRLELDDCVHLHELTEGWPIGLQLAAAAIERAPHYHTAIASLSARQGDIERYFIESLLERLPSEVAGFLTRIAILDPVSAELAEAVTGCALASAWLDQIMADTPIMTVAELGSMRLHALARDFLVSRFERLPAAEQSRLHERAAAWLAERGHYPEASRHALAAGDEARAHRYAEQSLWTLATGGNLAEAQQWIGRMQAMTQPSDVDFRLVTAWIMAFSERAPEARRIAAEVAGDPTTSANAAFVAALVEGCAAWCLDQIGDVPAIMARWPELPAHATEPVHRVAYANTLALVPLHRGDAQRARSLDTRAPQSTDNSSLRLALAIGRSFVAHSYLRNGEIAPMEELLQPAVVYAERTLGRRSTVACISAVHLAAALYERNELARADAMLAHRVDVVERLVAPDTIIVAYRTLARLAVAQGDERRAHALLENLHALGQSRGVPRFVMESLALQATLHSLRDRVEAAALLVAELDSIAGRFEAQEFRPYLPEFTVRRALARAYVALAKFDVDSAERELDSASAAAESVKLGRDLMTIQALRAVAAGRRRSANAPALLAEALSLATLRGCLRLAEDAHPDAAAMAAGLAARDSPRPPVAAVPVKPRAVTMAAGGLLTPKEAEVLRLLAANHSNKHIAKAMDISDETVKWHLKNLFSKLSAGTRRHAVDRARMMGLVAEDSSAA